MGNIFARTSCIVCFGLMVCSAGWLMAADAAQLKYSFKAGQTYTYQLKIEAQTPDYVETLTGESVYKVKSVDAASGQMTLTHSATLTPRRVNRQQQGGLPPRFGQMGPAMNFSSYNQRREVVIDPMGKVVRYEAKPQLPYMLGTSWGLLIEPLAEKDQKSWQVKRDIEVSTTEAERMFFPRPLAKPNVARSGAETIDYAVIENKDGIVTIERKYLLATTEMVDGEPSLQQKGTGTIQFDTKSGMIRSLEGKLTLFANDPGVTVKIPVTISATLLSAQDMAKRVEQQKQDAARLAQQYKESMEKAQQDLEKSNPELARTQKEFEAAAARGNPDPAELKRLLDKMQMAAEKVTPLDAAGVDAALVKLKSGNRGKVMEAAKALAVSPPVPQKRAEVAKALHSLVSDEDHFVKVEVVKALGQWGNAESVPLLIPLVDDENVFTQMAAMDALAKFKDERGAEAIAKQLGDMQARHHARMALAAMGPMVEKYVLPFLKHKDWVTRVQACEILSEAGTEKSAAALKEAARDRNGLVQRKAEDALRAIEARKK